MFVLQATLLTAGLFCAVVLWHAELAVAGPNPNRGAVSAEGWPHWRGGPAQCGVAAGHLPERPVVRWRFKAEEAFSASAVIAKKTVFVGCEDGVLYAIDLASGRLKWKYAEPEMIQSAPSVIGNTVYIGDDLGVLHAVDAVSGKKKWTFSTEGQIISSVNSGKDRIVFGSYDGFVYALNPNSGVLIWKFETGGRVHGTPAVAGGLVIAAGCDELLHVLNLVDGKERRAVPMGSVCGASAAVVGSKAYVGTYGNEVLGIDFGAGKVAWRFADPERQFPFMSSAAVTERLVVLGGRDKRVRALDRDSGTLKWVYATKGRVDSSPVIVEDRVFIGSTDGTLFALGLRDGKRLWRYETGSSITASPAVTQDHLVIGTLDGVLYCFGRPGSAEKAAGK